MYIQYNFTPHIHIIFLENSRMFLLFHILYLCAEVNMKRLYIWISLYNVYIESRPNALPETFSNCESLLENVARYSCIYIQIAHIIFITKATLCSESLAIHIYYNNIFTIFICIGLDVLAYIARTLYNVYSRLCCFRIIKAKQFPLILTYFKCPKVFGLYIVAQVNVFAFVRELTLSRFGESLLACAVRYTCIYR